MCHDSIMACGYKYVSELLAWFIGSCCRDGACCYGFLDVLQRGYAYGISWSLLARCGNQVATAQRANAHANVMEFKDSL